MEPTIPVGSLILVQRVAPNLYKVGDIITFRPPAREHTLVTHRIIKIQENNYGAKEVITKGDANTNGDSWRSSLGSIVGKTVFSIPYIGYGVQIVKTEIGFLVFAAMSFMFLVAGEVYFIWYWLQSVTKLSGHLKRKEA